MTSSPPFVPQSLSKTKDESRGANFWIVLFLTAVISLFIFLIPSFWIWNMPKSKRDAIENNVRRGLYRLRGKILLVADEILPFADPLEEGSVSIEYGEPGYQQNRDGTITEQNTMRRYL